jgi:spore germination cell wall hydrolase CwlJ-like protein
MPLPDPTPVIKQSMPIAHVDPKQLACMAKNIFYEASGESILGQAAVARVVLNRVNHGFAKTPCGVIYQAIIVDKPVPDTEEVEQVKICQFSWTCEDKNGPSPTHPNYQLAERIAHDIMAHDAYRDVVPKSTLFFHNVLVSPGWAYRQVATIGNHIFYSKEKNGSN